MEPLNLKIADYHDIPVVVDLLQRLHEESAYGAYIDFKAIDTAASVDQLLLSENSDNCIVLLCKGDKPVGLIGMSHMVHMFNKSEKTAIELAFYLLPDYRTLGNAKKLLQAFKYWAKRIGCTTMLVGKLQGTTLIETYKIKRIV